MQKLLFDHRIGLVLSGGGARGAYQAGFYQAMWDLELVPAIKVISGTSIGALNGALFAMRDRDMLADVWKGSTFARLFEGGEEDKRRFVALAKRYHEQRKRQQLPDFLRENEAPLFSQQGIGHIIDENLDLERLENSGKDVFACAYHIEEGRPAYFRLNGASPERLKGILMASAALPLVFRPVCIDGAWYSDGGMASPFSPQGRIDKTPLTPLADYDLDLVIVIYLRYEDQADLSVLGDAPVLEVYPQRSLEGLLGSGPLNVSSSGIRKKMEMGYADALALLAPIVCGLFHGRDLLSYVWRQQQKNLRLRNGEI